MNPEHNTQLAQELLPGAYDDLLRLAAARLATRSEYHLFEPAALVHEAYLRIEKSGQTRWERLGHFFSAMDRTMRRVLIDDHRRRKTIKRGGDCHRVELDALEIAARAGDPANQHIREAVCDLNTLNPVSARVVKLRFFDGMTLVETAKALGTSVRTTQRRWQEARTWLRRQLDSSRTMQAA